MRKPRAKLKPFAIYYKDGSYMIYDLTEKDYKALKDGIVERKPVELSVGFITTEDIRSVIVQKVEKKKKVEPVKPAVPELSIEEMAFLKATLAGIYQTDEGEVDMQ